MKHVFVYGTLKAGKGNHGLLNGATFIGPGVTTQPFVMKDGGFPAVLKTNEGHPVVGEIYAITDDILAKLDSLEGHPNLFCREEIPVDIGDSGVLQTCWMYFGNTDTFKHRHDAPVTDGVYNWRAA